MKNQAVSFKDKIIKLYFDYGFELEKDYNECKVLVFSMIGGYFNNVDIVPYSEFFSYEKAISDYKESGYSFTKRLFRKYEEVELDLFNGFFQLNKNKERFNNEYRSFSSSLVKMYGDDVRYKYLDSPYFVNEQQGEMGVVQDIIIRLENEKPILFLVEAAAGFGKTCTAYEIAKNINDNSNKVAFLAELSRNRQARIFKHVLLDEIDRVFPSLSSKLVEREIKSGRVVTILDGFDELLRDGDLEEDFKGKEPMLETIGHYLRGNAKLVLTTRKTVLFEGDSFFNWIESNIENFELVIVRLGQPRISDWLDSGRYQKIREIVGQEFDNISNPVLLSYLRCIKEEKFQELCMNPSGLVESYFDFMLEREKNRQELKFSVEEQHKILEAIALDMIELDYFSEEREYIIDLVLENCSKSIDNSIEKYPIESRPTREQIANKLVSHALLDRSTRQPNYIGFINNFIFGNYIARNMIEYEEWDYDKWLYLELAIISYKHRDITERSDLFNAFKDVMPFLSTANQLVVSIELINKIDMDLLDAQIDSISFFSMDIGGEIVIKDSMFINCIFTDCSFYLENIEETTFLKCQFYNCNIASDIVTGSEIHIVSSNSDNEIISKIKNQVNNLDLKSISTNEIESAEKAVLERFWPVGRDTITYKHRPIRGICNNYGGHTPSKLYNAIQSLKRKEILLEPQSSLFVEINFNKMVEIKNVLRRI